MRHVNAFGDDALGDLDAVALVDAMRTGRVSATELVEAAIVRAESMNPVLNGLAHERFDEARAHAATASRQGGYFDGVPTFIKDNVDVEGMPTMQGTDAWDPRPQAGHGDFAFHGQYRYWRFRADTLRPAIDVAIQHGIANHQYRSTA